MPPGVDKLAQEQGGLEGGGPASHHAPLRMTEWKALVERDVEEPPLLVHACERRRLAERGLAARRTPWRRWHPPTPRREGSAASRLRGHGRVARPDIQPASPYPARLAFGGYTLGNRPSMRPGTATTSHSRPFAEWTVCTWTASGSGGATGESSPDSSSLAASSHARNAPSVACSAPDANERATSANASRAAVARDGGAVRAQLDVEPVTRHANATSSATGR